MSQPAVADLESRFACKTHQKGLDFANEMTAMTSKTRRLSTLIDELQSSGRYTFTAGDITIAGQRSQAAFEAAIRRLKQQRRIASPRRGFFVIVPTEYREAGCTPASWFIDDLMNFFGQPYYVGLLSAAAVHGAAHQQPMAFQVMTDRPTRPARAGRVRIEFHMNRHVLEAPAMDIPTETGSMRVSTPEATTCDLIRFYSAAGHIDNVVTVLAELAEQLDPEALTALSATYPVPVVQRLGYLLDRLGASALAERLARALKHRRRRAVLLVPGEGDGDALPDGRWRVIPNVVIEADL